VELIISSIREEATGVKTFALKPATDAAFSYKAGQFLTFLHKAYGRETRRSYSLSSALGEDDVATITVKRIANGIMSRWLIDDARPGDVLHCDGAATGIFTLPQDLNGYRAVWLFAAGIGITPVFSLLKSLLAHTAVHVVLMYSNRSREETVFYDTLRGLEQRYERRLTIAWLWSDTQDLRRARLSKESFPMLLREYLTDDPAHALCYVCGPGSYMWLVQLLLQDAGVPSEQIRREVFVIDKAVPKYLPADKDSHQVTVHANGRIYSFINTYPESILKSAKTAGISLPYSCETGQCGSCTAICTEGKVWMSYNEVLTEKDLAAGRVLTCTGHAVGGDVVLQL
jgi:ferredoxin-NADP reductase